MSDERARWDGLSSSEAARRLSRDGPNELPTPSPPSIPRLLLAQFVHFFALMLWVAAGLAVIGDLPSLGVAIVLVIVINGVFAFAQEYRAVRAAEKLRELLPERVFVRRDGRRVEVDATELVVDDIVVLEVGDRISADIEILDAHSLRIETAALTGESVPESVQAGEQAYAGTFVVEGEAIGRVEATGADTELAGIAELTDTESRPESPLSLELNRVVRIIATIALTVGVTFLLVTRLLGMGLEAGFLFAIGVTVALVPEGLLPTVTLSLASGARRMARENALVRRLDAVETLGSTTVICTDKTGTLTRNEMAVVEAWTPAGRARVDRGGYEPDSSVSVDAGATPSIRSMARVARTASNGRVVETDGKWVPQGDPTEAAIDTFARRIGVDVARSDEETVVTRRYPFDADRKRMSIVADDEVCVKGAPESVFERCRNSAETLRAARSITDELTEHGLRVLAVARRDADTVADWSAPDAVEADLELLGVLGMRDPPRPDVGDSLQACREAGISIVMLTGDHAATARAIADDVGLRTPDDMVVDGHDLPDDRETLGEVVDNDGVVVSRVSPEQKLRIAEALQDRDHVVAMTGDGVNDGPALRQADIGVAMGAAGTDVAREAADLVLLDDHFATIVTAVELGRSTFSNIRKFLTYHLTDNVAELTPFVVWALSGGQFPLAIGVLQILAIDLVTDQFPSLALALEPPTERQRTHTLTGQHLIDGALLRRVFFVLGPTISVVTLVAFSASLLSGGWQFGDPATGTTMLAASGAAWATIVLGQMANAFAVRSPTEWPGALGWTSNPYLPWAVASGLVFLVVLLYVPWLAQLLGQAPPPAIGWAVAVAVVPAVFAMDMVYKRWPAE